MFREVQLVHSLRRCQQSCWEQLDEVNLEEWFLKRVPTLKKCPHFMRGRLRHCFAVALRERYRAKGAQDSRAEERAWKLFGLVPVMLLHRPRGTGSVGKDELVSRADDFVRGRWTNLLENIHDTSRQPRPATCETPEHERRGRAVLGRVRQGQVSTCEAGVHLASFGTQDSWRFSHSCKKEGRKKGSGRILKKLWNFFLTDLLDFKLSPSASKCNRQVAPQGLEVAPTRCCERAFIDDPEVFQLLFRAAEDCASASMPETIRRAFMSASMTALQKPQMVGCVALQRALLSAGSLQGRWRASLGKRWKQPAALFQFALSTRALAQIVSDTQSGQSQTRTPCARCCPSKALVFDRPCVPKCHVGKVARVPARVASRFVRATWCCNPTSCERLGR